MAVSFDDKLLGEKAHYYCSSDEDEADDSDKSEDEGEAADCPQPLEPVQMPDINDYKGYSSNTGPKGVINDWRRFKQLETEQKLEQEREKIELGKKLSLTCRSAREDDAARAEDEELEQMFEEMEDGFLEQYRQKRIEEMKRVLGNLPKFGVVYELTKDQFVNAIDLEKPQVTVIIHLFEDNVVACDAMHGCLKCLAQEYMTVKFCRIRASVAKLSAKFSSTGVPALLVYKNKELISNFVRLQDVLGEDFFAVDVEGFLLEHGLLPDKSLKPAHLITEDDDGSDFDLD